MATALLVQLTPIEHIHMAPCADEASSVGQQESKNARKFTTTVSLRFLIFESVRDQNQAMLKHKQFFN